MKFQGSNVQVKAHCRICGKPEWVDPPPTDMIVDLGDGIILVDKWVWYCKPCTEITQEFDRAMVTFGIR